MKFVYQSGQNRPNNKVIMADFVNKKIFWPGSIEERVERLRRSVERLNSLMDQMNKEMGYDLKPDQDNK